MSVYVGIDVHRKRSQVAVVTGDGKVQLNRNVVNGSEPMLRLIGGLPAGTPVAFEAAYGWGWLIELLEDYGFDPHMVHPLRCKAIASARLKNDKVDAAILAQPRPPVGLGPYRHWARENGQYHVGSSRCPPHCWSRRVQARPPRSHRIRA